MTTTAPTRPPAAADQPLALLTPEAVATRIRMSRSFVYTEVRAGRIAHEKRGKCIRFTERAVADWLAANRKPADAGKAVANG